MREIKFRGLTKDGEWVYGDLTRIAIQDILRPAILEEGYSLGDHLDGTQYEYSQHHEVIPETVGQYTGLKDKNGKEIYEGDVIIGIEEGFKQEYTVQYCLDLDYPAFDARPNILDIDSNVLSHYYCAGEIEVIGNIHEQVEA